MSYLTIRNVPPNLACALENEKHRRHKSLNQTVIDLLAAALGVGTLPRSNGLAKLAGQWTPEEHQEFNDAIAVTEQIDEELWR